MYSHLKLSAPSLATAALALSPVAAAGHPATAGAAPPPKPPPAGARSAPVAVTPTTTRVRADRVGGRVSFTFV
jgi:hypothetical protein